MANETSNINVQAGHGFVEQVRKDPSAARKRKRVEGSWNFAERQPQFRATLEFPGGKVGVDCELPPFAGGWGTSPDPIQYYLFGMAACYATAFAGVAVQEGVRLTALRVHARTRWTSGSKSA